MSASSTSAIASGVRPQSIGRIASCASCSLPERARNARALRGRYAVPKLSRTIRRAWPAAARDSAGLSVRT